MSNRLVQLELFALRLPFRRRFAHARAQRNHTDTVVVAALLADGTVGFGEGLPRTYVTGETIESVLYNITDTLAQRLGHVEPRNFPELLELVDNLPFTNQQDQIINTARCAVELALLDAYSRHFKCSLSNIIGWMSAGALATKVVSERMSVSGVLGGVPPDQLKRQLRQMRWFGLRDFKIKLGCTYDQQNLAVLDKCLGPALARGRTTLRADANAAWDVDTAMAMCSKLADIGICCLEQPLARDDRDHWRTLADLTSLALMADESLVTFDDAEYLARNDLVDYFNIRISKNGGLLPAIRMAELAAQWSRGYQLGAMVGESGILAAAGRHFLQMVPAVTFTEICYSTFLLDDDIVEPKIRFGYRGRLPTLNGPGLGVEVRREKIARFLAQPARKVVLA